MSNKTVKVQDSQGGIREALIQLTVEQRQCRLSLNSDSIVSLTVLGDNFFECLIKLRTTLQTTGHIILCQGATENVYPSRMAAQMIDGLKAYKLTLGKQASMSDLIDIFEHAESEEIATVEGQRSYFEIWLKSLKK